MTILWVLFVIVALLYIGTQSRRPYPLSWLVKAAPILLLLLIALLSLDGAPRTLIGLALLFCAGGDIALEWDRDRLFVVGLALFLVGHLFYVAAFLLSFGWVDRPLWLIPLILLVAASVARHLWPNLGALRGPVGAYMVVIVAMSVAAVLRQDGSWLVILGALSFMASDSLIALDKFSQPISGANLFIMATYYLAQGLIVAGLVSSL